MAWGDAAALVMQYSPWLGTLVAIVLGSGIGRRLALRLAMRRAWTGHAFSLLVLKYLGGKKPGLNDFEDYMPSLPVPPLSQTLKRWLESLESILDSTAMAEARASAAEFEADSGKQLQKVLEQKAARSRNWLSDWWEEFAYLRGRLPLPTYANYFCTDSGSNLHGPSHEPDPVKRVALLIAAAMDFKHRIDSKTLMPLRIRGVLPVCMEGMHRIFGTTRVPGTEKDEITTYHIPANGSAHVLLIVGSSLFCIPVLVNGLRVPTDALESCIRDALKRADAQAKTEWGSGRYAQARPTLLPL